MSRRFWSRVPEFAWAGLPGEPEPLWVHWFQHGRHGRPGRGRGEGRFGEDWGEDYRTRRGDIKFILLELLSDRPAHGYDLIKEMEARHGGFRRLSPGSVYPTLQLLEEGGYLTSELESGKRVYTITEAGRQLLAERTEQARSPRDAFDRRLTQPPEDLIDLRQTTVELAEAVKQVARSGRVEQMQRVRERLEQVKREIYSILAEE